MSDDAKHGGAAAADETAAAAARLLPAERLELGGGQLATLAAVLQAPAAVAHAVDSGILHAVLVQAVHGTEGGRGQSERERERERERAREREESEEETAS